jgi:tRNA1Val (adenine37-N6)-methyltransferase
LENKDIKLEQPSRGHRFSLDSLLLAQSIFPQKKCRILELGCGCGIISIIIANSYPDVSIVGIDIQKNAVENAKNNVLNHGLSDRVTILERDLRALKGNDFEPFQYIVCNPPFRRKGSGRSNVSYEKQVAREEIACTMDDILRTSRKMLENQGELSLIYPSGRVAELMMKMPLYNITPNDLIPIYTKQNHPATWAIVKGCLNSRSELKIHESLCLSKCHHGRMYTLGENVCLQQKATSNQCPKPM